MALLNPNEITSEAEFDDNFDTFKNAYIPDPAASLRKYTDPERLTEVIIYLEEKVFENGTELAAIKSTLIDIKSQLNRVDCRLRDIMPDRKPLLSETGEVVVIDRSTWGALKSKGHNSMRPLGHPITKVNFTFSTKTESCVNRDECARLMRKIQERDMRSGLPDIAHNFLVAEDGNVYEGRGWDLAPAVADTNPKCESFAVDIAFAGDYQSDTYPFELFETAINLVNSGIEQKFVSENYNLL